MLAYNLYLLHKYHKIFNGTKVVCAAEDKEGYAIDDIHLGWMLNDTHSIGLYDLNVAPHASLSMQESLFKMLESVESTDPEEISFFAYAKDTSLNALDGTDVGELSARIEPMYRNALEDAALVDDVMEKHPVGHSGSFFWINHKEFFKPGWRDTIRDYDGTYDFCVGKKAPSVERNWDPSRVTIVTTSMNRWEFLKESLQSWLGRGFNEIIIVDWSSDTRVSSLIKKIPHGPNPVTILRILGEKIFNGGMARNIGAIHATTDYLLFIDSDMIIRDWSMADGISMVPGRFYHGPHNIPPFGTSLVRREDFWNVNGYSELYPAYGWEDNDLYNRLEESGLQRCLYDDRMVEHMEHDDELRARHRDQKGMLLHETVWANRDIEKWTKVHSRAVRPFVKIGLTI